MEPDAIEKVAQRYRDEGYDVVVNPLGEQVPSFAAGFQLDLIAARGGERVVVKVKVNRVDLSNDKDITRLAEIVNAEPGWRLDVVVLEHESAIEKAAQEAPEPSSEQLAQILNAADEMAEKGFAPYACVIAWGGLEAAMRRLKGEAELYGRTTPAELMRALYGNGFLSRDQFERVRSYKIRTQVVHGLVPPKVESELVHFLTATARQLAYDEEAAVSSN